MTKNFVCMCIAHCQKQMYKTLKSIAILPDKTVARNSKMCSSYYCCCKKI